MGGGQEDYPFWRENAVIIGSSILILAISMVFRESLYGIFGEDNYVSVHLIMEICLVTMAFVIAIQSWMVFPHTFSNERLWIGALFFSLSILEIAHAITYKGMPFFWSESSTYKATWFFIIMRLTLVMVLFIILLRKDRTVAPYMRWLAYSAAALYSFVWIALIYSPVPLFPELVQDGIGTTQLKNGLQYAGIFVELLIIGILLFRLKSKKILNLMLLVAFIYLVISDYLFTTYKSVYDINNFIGHLFQFAGFYFLQRAMYHTSVEEPFLMQKKTEEQLKAITDNMGEGLLVFDTAGQLTYMNPEAERILQWSKEEFQHLDVLEVIQLKRDETFIPVEKPSYGITSEGWVIRKNGKSIPVSYVATPLYEHGQLTGQIMVFSDISQQKKDQELIHYMAFHDELTKLPNIRYLKDKWMEGTSKNHQSALLVLDIDRFKNINEALGHSFGDSILQSVAERLQEGLGPDVFLGRLSGDEFAILLPSFDQEEEVNMLCSKIQQIIKGPFQVKHLLLNITVKIGISFYPAHGKSLEDLLQRANIALMEVQQKNYDFTIYQPVMEGKALDRLMLENDLYDALMKDQLHVVYQPQVNVRTGQVESMEALIRWHHPIQGWISPAHFIPIAEDTGLIIPIGEWVLRTACQQVKQWQKEGLPCLGVAVNLSTRQFYSQDLVETVKGILEELELSPWFLELEITESMMMNIDHATNTLHSLKQLGCKIAIDDFGTGYSSLHYLKHLPIDRLKIDQSFIRDLNGDNQDQTIVSTIISMARHLGMEVIAEGVETPEQSCVLQRKKCYHAQGYLYSPPLPPEQFFQQFVQISTNVNKESRVP